MTTALLPLLHLCDSLFPIGAFSHSDGLESVTSSGQLRTGSDLSAWLAVVIGQSLRHLEAPAVARAWQAARDGRIGALRSLDEELYALRPSAAGREATRAMGARLLSTWMRIRPETDAALSKLPGCTLPVAFGAVCAVSNVARQDAVAGYAYTRLSTAVSSALRLMVLGQHEGHRVLSDALRTVTEMATAAIDDDRPLAAFTPVQDIAAMRHQYLHSRLFRS